METGGEAVRESILKYLRASEGHTVREVAQFTNAAPLLALQWLHEMELAGMAAYTSKDDLWRATC